MRPTDYSCPRKEWGVDLETATFCSPSKDERSDQVVIFPNEVKDGSISASITVIQGQWNKELNYEFQEGAFVFRYADEDRFYVAGMGGFGKKFYIAKSVQHESPWQLLQGQGSAHDLQKGKTYNLRIEFVGGRMTLRAEGVPMISATNDAYLFGRCGLRTNRTEAKFQNVDINPVLKAKCFVIMPFAAEMSHVYSLIKETVEKDDIDCERADDRFVSQPILDDVKARIASADLVIIDFTRQRPNVYYEAGLADALKKKWIVLAQSRDDLAFDVQHIRSIIYFDKMGYEGKFKEDLHRALEETLGATDRSGAASSVGSKGGGQGRG